MGFNSGFKGLIYIILILAACWMHCKGNPVSSTKYHSQEALFDTEFVNVSAMSKRIWTLKSTVCICEDPVY
jgi:hypothetical protein